MANKDYSIRQEQLARFAKAMGHPARIAILQFLAKQETCYFGDIHEELPIAKATVSQHLKELKEAGTDTRRGGSPQGEVLHQPRQLATGKGTVWRFLRPMPV